MNLNAKFEKGIFTVAGTTKKARKKPVVKFFLSEVSDAVKADLILEFGAWEHPFRIQTLNKGKVNDTVRAEVATALANANLLDEAEAVVDHAKDGLVPNWLIHEVADAVIQSLSILAGPTYAVMQMMAAARGRAAANGSMAA